MTSRGPFPEITLSGIDGGNPLGFLAALGAAATAQQVWPELRFAWRLRAGGWRPVFGGCVDDEAAFLSAVYEALRDAPMSVFTLDKKLPFAIEIYVAAASRAATEGSAGNRRDSDFLAALGTDMYPKAVGKSDSVFQDTRFRMVRSGDAAGQGLNAYAQSIRQSTTLEHLQRTLFEPWDYQDTGFGLRWDPLEDQRYALRWRDPSKSGLQDGPGLMLGANSLALEALRWFPTVAVGTRAETTGFVRNRGKRTYFTWPIWDAAVDLETVRSLLSLPALRADVIRRDVLAAMGIVEVYRSERIQQSQYYSNFAPARPA